jgi:prepilin-type N-terminal cleavage/methylation domain-containing protein
MTVVQRKLDGRQASGFPSFVRGFTMLELLIVLAIGMILTAMAIPQVKTQMYRYRLQGAVASSTWAIQSTRYQALMEGYPYQVVFTKSTNSYQIQDLPPGSSSYTNVGNSVPLSGAATVLNQDTTFQFKPNGYVNDPANLYYLTITYQNMCQKVTVTNYARITLSVIGPSCS